MVRWFCHKENKQEYELHKSICGNMQVSEYDEKTMVLTAKKLFPLSDINVHLTQYPYYPSIHRKTNGFFP